MTIGSCPIIYFHVTTKMETDTPCHYCGTLPNYRLRPMTYVRGVYFVNGTRKMVGVRRCIGDSHPLYDVAVLDAKIGCLEYVLSERGE